MKKNFTLWTIALVSGISTAQTTLWQDDFNDGDIAGWTVLDLNNDDNSWQAHKNIIFDDLTGAIGAGEQDIMAVYAIDLETGYTLGDGNGYYFNEWVVSPAIDLSQSAGSTQLIVNAQVPSYSSTELLSVYASTSLDQESFTLLEDIPLTRIANSNAEEFADYTVDISAYAGEPGFYVIFNRTGCNGQGPCLNIGLEINEVSITAAELGVNDLSKSTARIKSNPVIDFLELENIKNPAHTSVKIYDITGKLLNEMAYNEAAVPVSHLSKGLYFVSVSDGDSSAALKFIKE